MKLYDAVIHKRYQVNSVERCVMGVYLCSFFFHSAIYAFAQFSRIGRWNINLKAALPQGADLSYCILFWKLSLKIG
jgi:hypothetical protein